MCERIICPDLWVRRGKLSLMPEINVFSPQVWNSRIVHVSWQVYYRGRLLATYWPTISCICKICHLQISHNAPYLPPKFCITFFFHFSWVLQPSQEKLKTMLMQNFLGGAGGGANKVLYGKCANGVWAILWLTFWVASSTMNSRSLLILLNTIAGA